MLEPILAKHIKRIAPEIISNIERRLKITPWQILQAERVRNQLYKRVVRFFEMHDFLISPATLITPAPVEQRYVEQIDRKPCETYIDWFSITFALTIIACPAMGIPCGFTSKGLPIGVQIMGKARGKAKLLRVAKQFEEVVGISA